MAKGKGRQAVRAEGASRASAEAKARHNAEPWWMWLIAALGATLVVGTLGFTAYDGLVAGSAPPSILVSVEAVRHQNGGYWVLVRATNEGGSTAAELRVRGELKQDGQTLETSEASFDYVPARSQREGTLFFRRDPRAATLELSAVGYREP
jgi:uncharacterized protein (TIGR02588 family)